MAKPELGTKRVCVTCATRFYDLMKVPAICPNCGAAQPADVPRPRRTGGNVIEEKRLKKAPAPGLEGAEAEVETVEDEAEAEEDGLADTSELEDDADAITTDIEVEPEPDEKDL